jgi:hypothetical protein
MGAVLLIVGLIFIVGSAQKALRPEIVIEWSTATELDVAGFNLYRAESRDGPFEKVNDTLIPPAIDPLMGGDYAFTDRQVEVGKTYFYNLEEIELSGTTSINGPIEVAAQGLNVLNAVVSVALILGGIWSISESRAKPAAMRRDETV